MIKLSDMLAATLDDKDPLIALQINEVKRLEALDVPRNGAQRTPLVDDEGDNVYIIVDERGCYADWQLTQRDADDDAYHHALDTGQPHTVCQVMVPESGECPTVPVVTYTPTIERPHEWVICRDQGIHRWRWWAISEGSRRFYWASDLYNKEIQRFPTATKAQTCIDTEKIEDAYPWPVPKLTSSQ